MRKGHELTCQNGRQVRFNKPGDMKIWQDLTVGTPWEEKTLRVYEFRKLAEMEVREKNAIDDLLGF